VIGLPWYALEDAGEDFKAIRFLSSRRDATPAETPVVKMKDNNH